MTETPASVSNDQALCEFVRVISGGRLVVNCDSASGRFLVAAEDLEPHEPICTEPALLFGTDGMAAMRRAMRAENVEGMAEAWAFSEDGGPDPLAHMDIFSNFVLAKVNGKDASGDAGVRLSRLQWLCRASETEVDREAQDDKLNMIIEALKPVYQKQIDLDELRALDNILARNLEEFSGPPSVCEGVGNAPAYVTKRRYQGLFACKDLIQHSCLPNCMTHASPPRMEDGCMKLEMQIIPLRRVVKGERLTWSYLPYWKLLWPTRERRRNLAESWHFTCQCERCSGPTREVSMAFFCPRCGCGDFCPNAPVDENDVAAGGFSDRVAVLRGIKEMTCGSCALQLPAGRVSANEQSDAGTTSTETTYSGYVERCLAQEAYVRQLPCDELDGQDPKRLGDKVDLLGPEHWLRTEYASHVFENAGKLLGPDNVRVKIERDLVAVLQRVANASDVLIAGLRRVLGHDLFWMVPDLLLAKAIAVGEQSGFDAYVDSCQRTLRGSLGASSPLGAVAVARQLASSRERFLSEGLREEVSGLDEAAARRALAAELARVRRWIGGGSPNWEWALRRMWFCPQGIPKPPPQPRKRPAGSTASSRPLKSQRTSTKKRPAATATVRKRATANSASGRRSALKRPAAARSTRKNK
eukprot:TRINITY_DN20592_c0_g1_i1.p1 TRINITY_DN20592_c0_g1~~TRINITY_DN20592_c0_g1_i1.p1  ORF type:complete len:641 (+),score=99.88 TRINITY_DN20592_c0_g1_i1:53-1975(+)